MTEMELIDNDMKASRKMLPSIFTTCPDLRQFSSCLPVFVSIQSSGSSDPEVSQISGEIRNDKDSDSDPLLAPYVLFFLIPLFG